jgi:hypothetical protein
VVVTSDPEFLRLHQQGQQHAGIVYCPQGARSIGEIVSYLLLMYDVLEPADMIERVEYV